MVQSTLNCIWTICNKQYPSQKSTASHLASKKRQDPKMNVLSRQGTTASGWQKQHAWYNRWGYDQLGLDSWALKKLLGSTSWREKVCTYTLVCINIYELSLVVHLTTKSTATRDHLLEWPDTGITSTRQPGNQIRRIKLSTGRQQYRKGKGKWISLHLAKLN